MVQPRTATYADKATPPMSAVISMTIIFLLACYYLPSLQEIDELATPATFVNRLFPETVSIAALAYIRFTYSLLCLSVSLSAYSSPGVVIDPTYLPASKLRPTLIKLKRLLMFYPFTSWSWQLLGLHFGLSAFIAHQTGSDQQVHPWILRFAFISWETTAPLTLLVSAVIKYAIWPMALKTGKVTSTLRRPRVLLQHNANVFMSLTELALLGGLPLRISHLSLSVLFGTIYVFFTWSVMNHWNPPGGPAVIYFFMDPTLGSTHTFALYMLLAVLMLFHGIYAGVGKILETFEHPGLHIGFVGLILLGTWRFRD